MPILDEVTSLVAGFAQWVMPVLLEQPDAGNLKAQMAATQFLPIRTQGFVPSQFAVCENLLVMDISSLRSERN